MVHGHMVASRPVAPAAERGGWLAFTLACERCGGRLSLLTRCGGDRGRGACGTPAGERALCRALSLSSV